MSRPALSRDTCRARVLAFLATIHRGVELDELPRLCPGLASATIDELAHAIGSLMATGHVVERMVTIQIEHRAHRTAVYYCATTDRWEVRRG